MEPLQTNALGRSVASGNLTAVPQSTLTDQIENTLSELIGIARDTSSTESELLFRLFGPQLADASAESAVAPPVPPDFETRVGQRLSELRMVLMAARRSAIELSNRI